MTTPIKEWVPRLATSAGWPFLRMLPACGGAHAIGWWALVLARGLLPAVFTLATGALVGAVARDSSTAAPLAVAGGAFVAMQVLAPVHDALSSDLGARVARTLRRTLLEASTAPNGVAHLESPALNDDLARARMIDFRIDGPSIGASLGVVAGAFGGVTAGVVQAGLVSAYRWWAGPLLVITWASTYKLLNDTAGWAAANSPEVADARRHAQYAFALAVDPPAAKEIRVFGLSEWVVDRFTTHQRRVVDMFAEGRRRVRRPLRYGLGLIVISYAVVLAVIAADAMSGRLPVDELAVCVQAALGVSAIAGTSYFSFWVREAAQPVQAVESLAPAMAAMAGLPSGSRSAEGLPSRAITFDNVGFTYRDAAGSAPVLDGLNLTIPAGSSLAIVGPNGAGKTTITKLLARLYDVDAGAIRIDGVDVRDLDIDSWRSRLAVLFQDFISYELPLRDNVAPRGSSEPHVLAALQSARAGHLAGLDTVLSKAYEGGTDLSGGQWQRVALARALCAVNDGASIVVLDEPTAQVDVRAEAEIFDRLLDAARGCTIVLISHRFSTVRHADRIAVVEHGRVIELGSHDELMAVNGRYRQMFDLQASRFVEEL